MYILIFEMTRVKKAPEGEILEREEEEGKERKLGNLDFPNACHLSLQIEPIAPSISNRFSPSPSSETNFILEK